MLSKNGKRSKIYIVTKLLQLLSDQGSRRSRMNSKSVSFLSIHFSKNLQKRRMNMEQEEIDAIERLILQIPRAERQKLRDRIFGVPKKKRTWIEFPKVTIRYQGAAGLCTTKKAALQHLGEILLLDIEKKSSSTIKAHVVEALATLAELEDNIAEKKATLMRAARIVLEEDRLRLFNKVASLAAIT
jgi:hypothetical protein